jgi:hypothetical protein
LFVSRFSIRLTSAPSVAFPSVASRDSAIDQLLGDRPGSLEPGSEVGDLLNALVDSCRQFARLVWHLLSKTTPQIEYQFPL